MQKYSAFHWVSMAEPVCTERVPNLSSAEACAALTSKPASETLSATISCGREALNAKCAHVCSQRRRPCARLPKDIKIWGDTEKARVGVLTAIQ